VEVHVRKVFISYSRLNRAQVDTLVEHLGVLGCQTWIDSSLQGGQQWWNEILGKIADCDVFMPVISRDALNSTACQREFDWAEALRKPVLPVAVEPLSRALPARLSVLQVVDYFDPAQRERNALTLAGALAALPPAPSLPEPLPAPPDAPLSYLTDLVELVSGDQPLDHDQQRQLLVQLESALRSVDPHEREGGLAVLERFSTRENLYADVDRRLTWLKANTPAPSPSRPAAQPPGEPRQRPTAPRGRRLTPSVAPPPAPAGRGATAQPKRRTGSLVAVAALAVVALALVAAYVMFVRSAPSRTRTAEPGSTAGQTAAPIPAAGQTAPSAPHAGSTASPVGQTVLPFTAPLGVAGVAVDTAGNVYLTEAAGVQKLAAGATASVALPFPQVGQPQGIAVDASGAVYVSDYSRSSVWKLASGAGTPAMLQFTGLKCGGRDSQLGSPNGVAVDKAGAVYVADAACQGRVVTLPAGSTTAAVLPFAGLVNFDGGVAVDSGADVYITDNYTNRVLKLPAGASVAAALPFTGLSSPQGVAVDGGGSLYVADTGNNRVLKLPAGASTPTALPFTGLSSPQGVAVDGAGNVYVCDRGNDRVLKLAAG
jgi:DNA-binding beta-propeller fold protein YncE